MKIAMDEISFRFFLKNHSGLPEEAQNECIKKFLASFGEVPFCGDPTHLREIIGQKLFDDFLKFNIPRQIVGVTKGGFVSKKPGRGNIHAGFYFG